MIYAEWFSMILGNCLHCKKIFRKREQKYKFCSLICSSGFNRNGLKNVTLPQHSSLLAEFIGILLGDGSVSKYQTGVTLNSIADKDYIPKVIEISKVLFPEANVSAVKKGKFNAIELRISSRIVSDFLREMGIISGKKKVPLWILHSNVYRNSCVRGLFDTEGSVSLKKYIGKNGTRKYYQLNFRNYDKEIMRFVRDTLLELNLKPTMTLTKSLYLSNPYALKTFLNEIKPTNPKLITKLDNSY